MTGMEFRCVLVDPGSGTAQTVITEEDINRGVPDDIAVPVVLSLSNLFSQFRSSNRTTAGTTIITEPLAGGSVQLVDLLISSEKKNAGSVSVQFTDGANTIILFSGSTTDAPVNIAIAMAGRWQGWKDARLEMVTVSTVDATVSVSYLKRRRGLDFAEWDSFR